VAALNALVWSAMLAATSLARNVLPSAGRKVLGGLFKHNPRDLIATARRGRDLAREGEMAQEWEGAGGSAYDGAGSKARTVVVIKRSLSPGFAGIPNPLFADSKTIMLFGDGREMVQAVVKALKEG
jgi:hypothetical protein